MSEQKDELTAAYLAGCYDTRKVYEQRLAEANARIDELETKEALYDEHSDAVKKCLTLNKQLVATEKALRWVCDVYIELEQELFIFASDVIYFENNKMPDWLVDKARTIYYRPLRETGGKGK